MLAGKNMLSLRVAILLTIISQNFNIDATTIGRDILLECNYCHETTYGDCAQAVDLDKEVCSYKEIYCVAQSYYDPWNRGYGGKYNFHRGCSPCENSECAENYTMATNSLLREYIRETNICNKFYCNEQELDYFELEDAVGIKT